MKKTFLFASLFLLIIPLFAFGQGAGDLTVFQKLVTDLGDIVKLLPGILATLAVAAFFWGLTVAIFSTGQEDKAKGKSLMVWGLIAIFIIFSLWGIITFIGNIFGIDKVDSRKAPGVVTSSILLLTEERTPLM
jgi:amino acid permease